MPKSKHQGNTRRHNLGHCKKQSSSSSNSSSSSSSSSSDSDYHHEKHNCKNRTFRDHSDKLREILGDKQYKHAPHIPTENVVEVKYEDYLYNGLFHKGLEHNSDGTLKYSNQYENLRDSIIQNDQTKLASVPLAPSAVSKFVNPLSSWATMLIGTPQYTINPGQVPTLFSDSGAAEMVELYSMELARDVEFRDYLTDPTIQLLTGGNYMNKPNVLINLPDYEPRNALFTDRTLFRGISPKEHVGPYISQLLYLDVPMGATTLKQIYGTPKPVLVAPGPAGSRVEWGVNRSEAVLIQNTQLTNPGLPPATSAGDIIKTYIFSGRSLAEAVHSDPAYQFYYQASQILSGLGASPNPGFPVYPNQVPFITGSNGPNVQCAIGEVTGLALKHAWFWKWQHFRRQRPEAFALGVDVVKNTPSENPNKYDISDVVLSNDVLTDIAARHSAAPYNSPNSYTLSGCYREGSPLHPAFPSGHATIAGACCTILKIFYDAEKLWSSLPGVIANKLSGGVLHPVQAGFNGASLEQCVDADVSNMTIYGEIDKLASNVSFGRNWAGIHYRTDAIGGMLIGEQVAIKYMEDCLSACVENNLDGTVPKITFRKFDDTMYTLVPTICQNKHH